MDQFSINATLAFLQSHTTDDPVKLLLQQDRFPEVDMRYVAQQIEGQRQAMDKWPTLARFKDIQYPPKLNREQSSSETTATYKATLFATPSFTVADLTGGMGIDTMAFATIANSVDYVEQDPILAALAEKNFSTLGLTNIRCHCDDSMAWLTKSDKHFDIIYIDPARRDPNGQKMAAFEKCTPNIIEHLDMMLNHCNTLIVKASPMIDLALATQQLGQANAFGKPRAATTQTLSSPKRENGHCEETNVAQYIIAVKNECKEVLFAVGKHIAPKTHCINLSSSHADFVFEHETERNTICPFATTIEDYIYEPNAAILKGGGFKCLTERYPVKKFSRNTHLYCSTELVTDFPGRTFRKVKETALSRKKIQGIIPQKSIHIVCRNYPIDAPELMKQLGLKEGGDQYLIATTFGERKIGVICERIK